MKKSGKIRRGGGYFYKYKNKYLKHFNPRSEKSVMPQIIS